MARAESRRQGREVVVDVQLRRSLVQTDPAPANAVPHGRHAVLQVIQGGTCGQGVFGRKPCAHPEHQRAQVFRRQRGSKLGRQGLQEPPPLHGALLIDKALGDVGVGGQGGS